MLKLTYSPLRKTISGLFLILFAASAMTAQPPKRWTSGDIHQAIQKLNFLGSALYVAAHPDDENTRLISYLSNGVKAETAYLSMTRGDGGQNLIGPEIAELLGVIRTQELLAARRVDGGTQMFTRANDFGFSKNPDETLKIWNKDAVLSDVVWAIRKWQPDVIINRFWHEYDDKWDGRMHGHHTSSAILSKEAFDLAAKSSAYPGQLKYVDTWQPKRLFFNTTWWFYGSREEFDKADKSNMVMFDVGTYFPILGKSNNEIAAESRSMHKCQGMGSTGSRGEEMEYLQLLKGDMPGENDLFAGINTTWSRVKGGEPIGKVLADVEKNFRYEAPYASLPGLMQAYGMIRRLPDGHWKKVKQAEIETVIEACMGLFAEAVSSDYSASPGQTVSVNMEIINRSPADIKLTGIRMVPMNMEVTAAADLSYNKDFSQKQEITIPDGTASTGPYWLEKPWAIGMYTVEDQKLRGLPETPREFFVEFGLEIMGEPFVVKRPIVYKRTDPVDGEVYRPFEITPPVFVGLTSPVYVFADQAPRSVSVKVTAGRDKVSGSLALSCPPGWRTEPKNIDFELKEKGEEHVYTFDLYAPKEQCAEEISPVASVEGKTYNQEAVFIQYDHIPTQTVIRTAAAKAVKIDIKKVGNRIGYVMGAGDEIPASLEQIGYEVDLLNPDHLNQGTLDQYDAVIMGVRAYNTVDRLKFAQQELLDYVNRGGNLIVQYNTNGRLVLPSEAIAPYPLSISRYRVTVEDAEIRLLAPDHEILNTPNKITPKDFDGWVQERGLYFPDKWDEHFTPILSCNDPGEDPRDGGLLVAKYGQGYYIYTGYSWFRELPSGVPGAFRLFANMISLGKHPKP